MIYYTARYRNFVCCLRITWHQLAETRASKTHISWSRDLEEHLDIYTWLFTHMTWYLFWWSLWWRHRLHPVWLHFCFCHAVDKIQSDTYRRLSDSNCLSCANILQCRWGCVEGRQISPKWSWSGSRKKRLAATAMHAPLIIPPAPKIPKVIS